MAAGIRRLTLLLVLSALIAVAPAARPRQSAAVAESCPIKHGVGSKPLLFGGLTTTSCEGPDGKPCARAGDWAAFCRYDKPLETKWASTKEQVAAVLRMAKAVHGGDALDARPCDIYPYLRNRTLWVIGDSHTKDFFRGLGCFMIDFWDSQRYCKPTRNEAVISELHNLPVKPGEPRCMHLLGNGRVCLIHMVVGEALADAPQVAGGGVLNILRDKLASRQDIIMINYGAWHGLLNGTAPLPAHLQRYEAVTNSLAKWYKANKARLPHVIFRESVMQHTADAAHRTCFPAYPNYDWKLDPDSGALVLRGSSRRSQLTQKSAAEWDIIRRGGHFNAIAHRILGAVGMPVIPVHALTVPNHLAHAGLLRDANFNLDCQHYGSFGVTEIAINQFRRALLSGAAGVEPLPEPPAPAAPRDCYTGTIYGDWYGRWMRNGRWVDAEDSRDYAPTDNAGFDAVAAQLQGPGAAA